MALSSEWTVNEVIDRLTPEQKTAIVRELLNNLYWDGELETMSLDKEVDGADLTLNLIAQTFPMLEEMGVPS